MIPLIQAQQLIKQF